MLLLCPLRLIKDVENVWADCGTYKSKELWWTPLCFFKYVLNNLNYEYNRVQSTVWPYIAFEDNVLFLCPNSTKKNFATIWDRN